jgi:hypothetical protein
MKYKITMVIESFRTSPWSLKDQIQDKANELVDVLVRKIKIKEKRRSR